MGEGALRVVCIDGGSGRTGLLWIGSKCATSSLAISLDKIMVTAALGR